MREDDPTFEMICIIVRESGKAILIHGEDNDEEVWIPFSQIVKLVRDGEGSPRARIIMSQWIAQQKGLV